MPTKSPGSPEYGSRIEIIVTGLKFIGIQRDRKIYVEEFCTRLLCARARACVCVCVCASDFGSSLIELVFRNS